MSSVSTASYFSAGSPFKGFYYSFTSDKSILMHYSGTTPSK